MAFMDMAARRDAGAGTLSAVQISIDAAANAARKAAEHDDLAGWIGACRVLHDIARSVPSKRDEIGRRVDELAALWPIPPQAA